ncbi:MAG: glycosyl transferase family 2, partial [Planctomycetota bacterium]
KLNQACSERITAADIAAGRHCAPDWLAGHGQAQARRNRKLRHVGGRRGWLLDHLTTTRPSWNGHNASTWRHYAIMVNGFDTRMRYGGQDREFGERLCHAGIRARQIRHQAVCIHLDHPRGYATPESIAANRAIRMETRRLRRCRAPQGLAETQDDSLRISDD